jgi:hypothetical protein
MFREGLSQEPMTGLKGRPWTGKRLSLVYAVANLCIGALAASGSENERKERGSLIEVSDQN